MLYISEKCIHFNDFIEHVDSCSKHRKCKIQVLLFKVSMDNALFTNLDCKVMCNITTIILNIALRCERNCGIN